MAQWRCGGSVGGSGDVVAQMEAVEMWWLSWRQLRCGSVGDIVAQWRCGGSDGGSIDVAQLETLLPSRNVVAHMQTLWLS